MNLIEQSRIHGCALANIVWSPSSFLSRAKREDDGQGEIAELHLQFGQTVPKQVCTEFEKISALMGEANGFLKSSQCVDDGDNVRMYWAEIDGWHDIASSWVAETFAEHGR